MIKSDRALFNSRFSEEKYQYFINEVAKPHGPVPFRVAETPVFIPSDLADMLFEAAADVINTIRDENFKKLTDKAIPEKWRLEGEGKHPHFLCLDFGICSEANELKPMLIELQGFPTLFGFQPFLANLYKKAFKISDNKTPFLQNFNEKSYWELLKTTIIATHQPQEVILLDVDAFHQKTAIDFQLTRDKLGLEIVAYEDLIKVGSHLFYEKDSKPQLIKRIYNRLIFDEIECKPHLEAKFPIFKEPLEVEWATHPNWFYRISKYTLPLISSKFVPESNYLSSFKKWPGNLEDYVLKPLFSFAGQGVKIQITPQDLDAVKDPENWILQKKVEYAPAIVSPDGFSKVEIRLMYVWPENGDPQLCMNLARLSKGEMMGVNHNKNLNWVGGSVALF